MTQLRGAAEAATEEPILGDDRATDAGADGEHDHVAVDLAGAEAEFGPAGGVGVVFDQDRHVQARLKGGPERFVTPVDVRAVVDDRLGRIDETGGGDSGGDDLFAFGEARDHLDNGVFDAARVARRGWATIGADHRSELVDEGAGDLRASDINPNRVHSELLS